MKSRKCLEKRSAWQKIGNMLVSGDHFALLFAFIERCRASFNAKLRRSNDL